MSGHTIPDVGGLIDDAYCYSTRPLGPVVQRVSWNNNYLAASWQELLVNDVYDFHPEETQQQYHVLVASTAKAITPRYFIHLPESRTALVGRVEIVCTLAGESD